MLISGPTYFHLSKVVCAEHDDDENPVFEFFARTCFDRKDVVLLLEASASKIEVTWTPLLPPHGACCKMTQDGAKTLDGSRCKTTVYFGPEELKQHHGDLEAIRGPPPSPAECRECCERFVGKTTVAHEANENPFALGKRGPRPVTAVPTPMKLRRHAVSATETVQHCAVSHGEGWKRAACPEPVQTLEKEEKKDEKASKAPPVKHEPDWSAMDPRQEADEKDPGFARDIPLESLLPVNHAGEVEIKQEVQAKVDVKIEFRAFSSHRSQHDAA